MTASASDFITPLTFSTLSKRPVFFEFYKPSTGEWNNHVELALWADLIIIAPASANTLAKFAHGLCDNLLSAIYLSAKCPVFVAPAMDLDMYKHPSTVANLKLLESFGNQIIEAREGELASGLSGKGRMAEPAEIISELENYYYRKGSLVGKKITVTAGPTYEALDPVRFIGNHSTGKMGFAIAENLANRGAEVTLITGPVQLSTKHPLIETIRVTSADAMYGEAIKRFMEMDAAVLSAAVADYRPKTVSDTKIKKKSDEFNVEFVKNPDIAASLGKIKNKGQVLVGFALETNDEVENAQKKLESKNLDFIVLNSLNDPGAGFGGETNKVTILRRNQTVRELPLKSKIEVANDIADELETLLVH
jgi:phosphopantothenoylcysteine decarboxylase/phosphopantothenate--cysteine ligase